MSIELNKLKSPNQTYLTPLVSRESGEEEQNTPPSVEAEYLPPDPQIPVLIQGQGDLLPQSKAAFLGESQKNTLTSILDQSYPLSGKNGAPNLKLDLLAFLKELQQQLQLHLHPGESVGIALIGSTVGHIIDPELTGYNDLDFVIHIQVPIKANQLANQTFSDNLIKRNVTEHCTKSTNDIAICLATQLKLPQDNKDIGNNYFNENPSYYNGAIDREDLAHPTSSRCSIIKIGILEFKTVIDFSVDDEHKTIIPGLKNSSAFNRDDIHIDLTTFLTDKNIPLEFCSHHVPIQQAMDELKTKQLRTSRTDPSKCPKAIDNITFKDCYYPEEDTNREIYTAFLQNPKSRQQLINHLKKYKETHPDGAIICALSNFYINGANLGLDLKPFDGILAEVLPEYKEIPEKLLLKWFQLVLFLPAHPADHNLQLTIDGQTYHLLKPKCPLSLLQGFMELLQENPGVSLEKLPQCGLKFETAPHLFSSMKLRLEGGQLIPFNLFLVSLFPSALDGGENLELEMLLLLLTSLPKLESAEDRQKLIQQTKSLFEKINPKLTGLFDRLGKCEGISQLFLTCIQALASSDRSLALELWSHADREQLLSPVDELEASVCLEVNPQNKKESIALLERMIFRLSCVSKKLTVQSDSFNDLLLSCVDTLGQKDLDLKNLAFIQGLLKNIAPLESIVRKKITNKFLEILKTLQNNTISAEGYDAALQILKTILETETNAKLQKQALKLYSGFVQSCLNSRDSALVQMAEKILCSGIESTCPDCSACHAGLFSDLICTHVKTGRAEALLVEAIENKILSETTPAALIKAYFTILEGLPSRSKFVESALENPSLVHALLNSKTKEANDLALLLINHSHQVESVAATQNLAKLFKKISLYASEGKKNLELVAMLGMLLKLLPNLRSTSARQALVDQTQQFFEENQFNTAELFGSLNASDHLSASQLFLMCIEELSLPSPELALGLWKYADEIQIFADSAVNELTAFACIKKKDPTKEELILMLKETLDRLNRLSKNLSEKDSKQLDFFSAYLLHLVVKLGERDLTPEDFKLVQKTLSDISPLKCISPSLKGEIADVFLDALIKLAPQLLQKKEQQALLEILKKMPEKAAPKIARCLKACPKGYTLADGFFKIPLFVSTLIEEMKQGELENNIEWFTLLSKKNALKSNDQKHQECCIALLAQWARAPSATRYSQVLPAFQLLKSFIETKSKKGDNTKLKTQAINGYIDFVLGCIHEGEWNLLQEAEKALWAGSKFMGPADKANLFASLICAYPKATPAMDLFNKVLKQNILNETTPLALVGAYMAVLGGLTVSNPTKISKFAETALQNPTLVTCLLSQKDANASILRLMHCFRVEQTNQLNSGCQPKPHPTAIENLILLFERLYKNRNSSQDGTLDESIRFQTAHLFHVLAQINSITFKPWGTLINALASGKALFKGHEEMAQEGFDPALRKIINWMIERSPQSHSDEERKNDISAKLLAICERCEGLPCLPTTASDLQFQHLTMLTLLDRTEDLLKKLNNIQETWLYFRAIEQIITIFLTLEKSKQPNKTTETIEQILTLLENYREPNPLAKDLKFSNFYHIFTLLDTATLKDEPFVHKAFEVLEELLKSHPEKFINAAETCTDIIDAACKLDYLPYASSILDYAIRKNILVGKECIDALRFKVRAQAMQMIEVYTECLQAILKDGNSIQIDAFLNNSSFIDLLLLTSETKETNEMLLLLVGNSHLATSEKAIKSLLNLFKQLCAPAKIAHLSSDVVGAMIKVLDTNAMIPKTQAQEAKELLYTAVKRHISAINNFIFLNHTEQNLKELCLQALDFFEKHEKFPFDQNDSRYFQHCHMQNLISLDCSDKLLLKLQNIPDPFLRSKAILDALSFILKIKPAEFFRAQNEVVNLLEMLDECCTNEQEKIPNLDHFATFIFQLLQAPSTEDHQLSVLNYLKNMREQLEFYPEKFTDLKGTYTDLLAATISKEYFEFAESLLKIAEKQGVVIEAELISRVLEKK